MFNAKSKCERRAPTCFNRGMLTTPILFFLLFIAVGGITQAAAATFELTNTGRVLECNGPCVALTGTNTFAAQLAVKGGGSTQTPYMLANNGGVNQVWQYSGSGTNWTPITGTNTTVSRIAATFSAVYMLAHNAGANQVWQYSGSGTNWTPVGGQLPLTAELHFPRPSRDLTV